MSEEKSPSVVDGIVDDLVPAELDWRTLVCRYPIPAVTLTAVGAFFVGRLHGPEILSALKGLVSREVSRKLDAFGAARESE